MKNTKDKSHAAQELIDKLQTVVADAESTMAGPTPENAADALGTIGTRLGVARERLGDLYGTARDKVATGAKCTDTAIRSSPYQAIAIAVGVGLLAGLLVGRRKA